MRFWLCLFAFLLHVATAQAFSHGSGPPIVSGSFPTGTYFVAQNGNDNDTGTSSAHPWKTIAQVNAQTFGAGSTISFNGGDTFIGQLNVTIASGITTVNSYGTGRGIIQVGNEPECIVSTDVPTTINNIDCEGSVSGWGGLSDNRNFGIDFNNDTGSVITGGSVTNSIVAGFGEYGIIFRGASAAWSGATVSNNIVHDITGRGTTSNNSCIAAAGAAQSDHFTVSGNTVYNCTGNRLSATHGANSPSGFAIFFFNVSTGTASQNAVHDNAAWNRKCSGPTAVIATQSSNITFSQNEIYNTSGGYGPADVRRGCDGPGLDFDNAVTTSTMQYNYLHDNTFEEILKFTGSANTNAITIRFNIVQSGPTSVPLRWYNPLNDLVYNNTFYLHSGSNVDACFQTQGGNFPTSSFYLNNICTLQSGSSEFMQIQWNTANSDVINGNDWANGANGNYRFQGTTYTTFATYQAANPPGSANDITGNPNLTNPGGGGTTNGGTNQNNLTAYQLTASSPAGKGNGLNINSLYGITIPSTDFYGNSITNTTLPIGAAANK